MVELTARLPGFQSVPATVPIAEAQAQPVSSSVQRLEADESCFVQTRTTPVQSQFKEGPADSL